MFVRNDCKVTFGHLVDVVRNLDFAEASVTKRSRGRGHHERQSGPKPIGNFAKRILAMTLLRPLKGRGMSF